MQQQVPASANWKKDKGNTPARMGPNGPEMSDISDDEEEDEMALLQGQGGNVDSALKDNSKRNRIFWTSEKEDYLIRVYNHYRKTYSGGHGLKGKSWRYIAVHMTRRYSEDFDSKSCRNKMNVLKYDYDECKKMLDARRSGQDTDAFYSEIADRYPRALKWKDTPYPHMELLRVVFEENGDGLENMPELNEPILHLPVETPASRKRSRESMGGLSNYKMYKVDTPYAGQPAQGAADVAKVLDVLAQKMQAGFEEILQAIKTYPLAHSAESAGLEARRRAMEELQRGGGEGGVYFHILSNSALRERAFDLFKNVSLANDFMLYPAEYRHLFLDDLLGKMHK